MDLLQKRKFCQEKKVTSFAVCLLCDLDFLKGGFCVRYL